MGAALLSYKFTSLGLEHPENNRERGRVRSGQSAGKTADKQPRHSRNSQNSCFSAVSATEIASLGLLPLEDQQIRNRNAITRKNLGGGGINFHGSAQKRVFLDWRCVSYTQCNADSRCRGSGDLES